MLDQITKNREAACLLRPLPSMMADGSEPVRFGGRPRLPEDLAWPRRETYVGSGEFTSEHFVCEIDLAKMSRSVERSGELFETPDFPKVGSIFVFLPIHGEGLYGGECRVIYTKDDVSAIEGRVPPDDLADLRVSEFDHIHADGVTDDGRLLVPMAAEALPFLSARAVNPLAVNMEEAAGVDLGPLKEAHASHEKEVAKVLREARRMPPDPTHHQLTEEESVANKALRSRMPDEFVKYNYTFEAHHFDWQFIWDFAKEFYSLSYDLTLKHLSEMLDEGISPRRIVRLIRKLEAEKDTHRSRNYGEGRRPVFWTFDDPVAVKETFDWQAKRWMALSQFQTGYPPERMQDAFTEMLHEFVRHYEVTDEEGYNVGPRIGMLDYRVKGHDKHAGNTLVNAKDAFKLASSRAKARHERHFDSQPQATRWDSRVIQASRQSYEPGFSLGTMPLQMFGLGFEIQSAVSDHADDVLLLQIGDSFGLPLEIGPDMVVQLWIKPGDLAAGRFDRVEMTMDMT